MQVVSKEEIMNTVTSVVKRYPLATFFILTYIFSWWGYLVGLGQIPLGPVVAALIVVPLTSGKAGLKEWASRIVRWRVGLKWYAVALLLPVALAVAAVALNVLMGARALTFDHLSNPMGLLIEIFLVVFLLIGLGEEPGWRGYALPRLQEGRSALSATLILAVFGVIWHVPLFLTGDSPWSNIPIIVAGYIFFTWLFNNTRGSVLIALLLHTSGCAVRLIFAPMFSGADATRYFWLLTAVYIVVGTLVVILAGPARLSRRPAAKLEATGLLVAQPQPLASPQQS
jgi:membrane protease YdiL (CAAX protease family)